MTGQLIPEEYLCITCRSSDGTQTDYVLMSDTLQALRDAGAGATTDTVTPTVLADAAMAVYGGNATDFEKREALSGLYMFGLCLAGFSPKDITGTCILLREYVGDLMVRRMAEKAKGFKAQRHPALVTTGTPTS